MANTDFIFTADELRARRSRFCAAMDVRFPDWDTALFIDPVNQYYLTGTMQDGIVLIRRGEPAGGRLLYAVRRSFERALLESPLFSGSNGAAGGSGGKSGGTGASGAAWVSGLGEEIIPIASYRELAEAAGSELGRVYIEGDTMSAAVF